MASTIKVTNINTPDGTGNIIVDRPLSGSGASLTNLPAANLTGTLPAISGAALTNLPVQVAADNSITLAKMAGGTDGQIITYDASGNPVAIGPGTAGQVLTSAGANLPQTFADAGGGAWTLITSELATGQSPIQITGLSTTYSTFAISLQGMKASSVNNTLRMKVGNSSGIISTGYSYDSHVQVLHENTQPTNYSSVAMNLNSSNNGFQIGYAGGWSNADGFLNAFLYLQRGSTTDQNNPNMHGTYSMHSSGTGDMAGGVCAYRFANAFFTDMDRIEFSSAAGNIALGRISVYGISHS